jgi:autotransporter-associated beta strand protein
VVASGTSGFVLNGASNASLDVSKIGTQYQGFGSFAKGGASTWTLTGTTSAVTSWEIDGGRLAVSSDANLGAASGTLTFSAGLAPGASATLQFLSGFTTNRSVVIQPGGAIFDTNGNNATLGGVISTALGSNGLTKVGNGVLTLSATDTYTGATNVNAGVLAVTGSIASSSMTTVGSGAMLMGTGTVGATTVNGTFAPGSGTAGSTMTVNGSLTLATAATYVVQIGPTMASIANVTGTATLNNATVQAVFAAGLTNSYTILHTTGGLSGTFGTVNNTGLPSGFTETVTNVGNDVKLNLTGSLGGGGISILNVNQQNVANGLNNFFNNGGALPPGFLPVFSQTGGTLGNSLSQLSGEGATGAQQSANEVMSEFLNLVLDLFVYGGGGVAGGGTAHGFAPERAALPDDLALAYAKALGPAATKAPAFEQRWNVWARFWRAERHAGRCDGGKP